MTTEKTNPICPCDACIFKAEVDYLIHIEFGEVDRHVSYACLNASINFKATNCGAFQSYFIQKYTKG